MIKKLDGLTMPVQPQSSGPTQKTSGNPELDAKFREVSQMYEKQFLREMMKSMRSTVQDGGLVKVNQGEQIFREKLDDEYVEKWGDKGGIGLSDMIYEQLLFHYGPKVPIQKPAGPVQMGEKSNFTLNRGIKPTSTEPNQTFEFARKLAGTASPEKIVAPWSGLLKKKLDLGPNETFLEMWHDNGMKSRFVLKGTAEPLRVGQNLQEGEGLGYLSPETKNFFWNVSM
jgi:flagellar protein FlgJ